MQRVIVSSRRFVLKRNLKSHDVNLRYLATTPVGDVLFPTKSDFPSRHIGPRKTDVVTMLDTLGYKV